MTDAILSGSTGLVPPHIFSCPLPATHCSWDDYNTLALCNSFQDLTSFATSNCTRKRGIISTGPGQPVQGPDEVVFDCLYDYPGRRSWESPISTRWTGMQEGPNNFSTYEVTSFSSQAAMSTPDSLGGVNASLVFIKLGRAQDVVNVRDPTQFPFQMSRVEWYLCEQEFRDVTATPQDLTPGKIIEQPVWPLRASTFSFNATSATGANITFLGNISTYFSPSTGSQYDIDLGITSGIFNELTNWMEGNFSISCMDLEPLASCIKVRVTASGSIPLSYLVREVPTDEFATNITRAINAQMHTKDPGDNVNLTILTGEAFSPQPYIEVQWPWLALPIAEVTFTVILLSLSIIATRGQPLFKTSILGVILYGVGDWKEPNFRTWQPSTIGELERWAKGKRARLELDVDGRLKFKQSS